MPVYLSVYWCSIRFLYETSASRAEEQLINGVTFFFSLVMLPFASPRFFAVTRSEAAGGTGGEQELWPGDTTREIRTAGRDWGEIGERPERNGEWACNACNACNARNIPAMGSRVDGEWSEGNDSSLMDGVRPGLWLYGPVSALLSPEDGSIFVPSHAKLEQFREGSRKTPPKLSVVGVNLDPAPKPRVAD